MQVDHVHFYVEDATRQRDWLARTMGWQPIGQIRTPQIQRHLLRHGAVDLVLSSPRTPTSPISDYLQAHPAGVVDIAFRVDQLHSILDRVPEMQVPIHTHSCAQGAIRWATVQGWGELQHTIVANPTTLPFSWMRFAQEPDVIEAETYPDPEPGSGVIQAIDHFVLNVPTGELAAAAAQYQRQFGFELEQVFAIETEHSGLASQVLGFPQGSLYFNINEPTSPTSQIQEFLDCNRGAGIQHIALKTVHLVQTVAQLRQAGFPFLSVPATYYTQLQQRLDTISWRGLRAKEFQDIAKQGILLDWQPDRPQAVLLQIFSHPIFNQPTFFLS
jgi:4-hydroxyphenylpyruvate dioxygenase